jgi:hypothetical protein
MKLTYSDKPRQGSVARLATLIARIVLGAILLAAVAVFVLWTAQGR